MKTSKHGRKRIRQRVKTKKVNELLLKARNDGISIDIIKGSLRRYLDYIRQKHNKNNYIKLYKNRIFIFDRQNHTLITVLDLPSKFIHKKKRGV